MTGKPRDPKHKQPRGGGPGRAPKGEAGRHPYGKRPPKGYGSKRLNGRPPKGGRPGERPARPPTSSSCVLVLACWAGTALIAAATIRGLA